MIPEESEDMWHAYNIIAIGDLVKASTIRKVDSSGHKLVENTAHHHI